MFAVVIACDFMDWLTLLLLLLLLLLEAHDEFLDGLVRSSPTSCSSLLMETM